MKKCTLSALIVLSALATSIPAYAQTSNDEAIKSDVQAINKNNAEIKNDQNQLANDRAAATADSANKSYGKEAVDNVKIGTDKAAIQAKGVQKSANQKILQHHKNNVTDGSSN